MQRKFYIRDGITSIDQLKPYKMYGKDDKVRYCFHQMVGIINTHLNLDSRQCKQEMFDLGYDIKTEKNFKGEDALVYCDYWHYQLDAVFRNKVRNGQCNTMYVGTKDGGVDLKKLKRQPRDWELYMLIEWNKMFSHLADKHGYIKVEIWW